MQYDEFIARLKRPKRKGDHQCDCQCPAHEDDNQSLSVGLGRAGDRIVVHCQAGCSTLHVLQSLGLKMSDLFLDGHIPKRNGKKQFPRIIETYDYLSADGEFLYQVCRYDPKNFKHRRPDGNGGWIWSIDGMTRVLYRLPDLLASECDWVFVVEGEKDVNSCYNIGLPATCNVGGASADCDKPKWLPEYNQWLEGRKVCIIADKDKPHPKTGRRPGLEHAFAIGRGLTGVAADVRGPVKLPGGHVKDVSDWISAGGTADQLLKIAEEAEVFDPTAMPERETPSEETPPPTPIDTTDNAWGAPIPLASRVAEPLPDGIFTGWLGDFVEAVAAFTETPRELSAAFALAIVATMIQRRFTVQIEPGYFEPLAFWVVAAMASGNRKSAVLKELSRPLIEIESRLASEVASEVANITSEKKTIEAKITALRSKAAKTAGAEFEMIKGEVATLESSIPTPPKPARLFVQDVTAERLAVMIGECGERLSILSDEGGLFDLLAGRYSNGIPNLDLYLQAHCASFVRVDRGSRPAVILNHPCLTIGLSPQPAVLGQIIARPDFRGRGLLARFVYLMPQSMLGYRQLTPAPIPDDIRRHYADGINALANISPRTDNGRELPWVIQFDGAAYGSWKRFQAEVETMMRADGRLEHLTDWASKLPGTCARVAGLLHAVDYASCLSENRQVGQETMDRAILFCRTAIDHTLLAFDAMGADTAHDGARKLWRAIEVLGRPTFSLRDAWNPLRGTFPRVADIEPAVAVLEAHDYIAETSNPDFQRRGRPSRTFAVNPSLTKGWTNAK